MSHGYQPTSGNLGPPPRAPSGERDAALAQLKAVYDDGAATINGRTYTICALTHKERRRVFAYQTRVAAQTRSGDMSFLDDPAFEPVEAVIHKCVMFDGDVLCKRPQHFDEFPEDYITLTMLMMGVISYPFTRAAPTS